MPFWLSVASASKDLEAGINFKSISWFSKPSFLKCVDASSVLSDYAHRRLEKPHLLHQ